MPPAVDLLAAASYAHGQPHEQFRWLREHDPVHRHPEPDGPGFWAVTRHHDVKAVGRDPAMFSSSPSIMISDATAGPPDGVHEMMLMADPPVSYAEISARLGIAIGSIGPNRHRCLDKLRRDSAIADLIDAEAASVGRQVPRPRPPSTTIR